jgi:hypothetical protein
MSKENSIGVAFLGLGRMGETHLRKRGVGCRPVCESPLAYFEIPRSVCIEIASFRQRLMFFLVSLREMRSACVNATLWSFELEGGEKLGSRLNIQ